MTVPRLFHVAVPGFVHSRSFRCIWLLEELGNVDFEVCMLRPKDPYGPQMREYGVLHSQKIPTLLLDGEEIAESGVISQVLANHFGRELGLLGAPEEKLEVMQWIAMAETCITFRIPLMPFLMNPDAGFDDLKSKAIEPMRHVFAANVERFETHFRERGSDFLLASGFSVADTMCGWSLFTFHGWGIMDLSTGSSPLTLAYLERLQKRQAFRRAEAYSNTEPGIYGRGCVRLN